MCSDSDDSDTLLLKSKVSRTSAPVPTAVKWASIIDQMTCAVETKLDVLRRTRDNHARSTVGAAVMVGVVSVGVVLKCNATFL